MNYHYVEKNTYISYFSWHNYIPGKTLIIIDEIQACERALTSLKYFAENAPEYHVAAAGLSGIPHRSIPW